MRAAVVQLNSTEDTERNLMVADSLTRTAVAQGAELVVLPEKWTVLGTAEDQAQGAQTLSGPEAPGLEWACGLARETGIDLIAGSIVERVQGQAKCANTSVHIGPEGEVRAVYRKLHLFDVEVDGVRYAESEHEEPGQEIVLTQLRSGINLGLTVCYDIRFPELYTALARLGAQLIVVSASWGSGPGKLEQWTLLARARALDSTSYVAAAGQADRGSAVTSGAPTGVGGSLVVSPFGEVVAGAGAEPQLVVADIELDRVRAARDTIAVLRNQSGLAGLDKAESRR